MVTNNLLHLVICHRIILVTGGAGYIGSHACLVLLQAGYEVVVLDNLSNSSAESLKRVQAPAGKPLYFIGGDARDPQVLCDIFARHKITAVVHFAGLKAVGEIPWCVSTQGAFAPPKSKPCWAGCPKLPSTRCAKKWWHLTYKRLSATRC
jgi:NAD(P)-dependent dehydrogenase (short-subunit alcohol dehydrogenase family)